MQTVLTIAGFDPSSGAGVTADLAVFQAHGLFGTSAITALTVQTTVGVRSVHATAGEVLRDTLDMLEDDLPAAGIKIGMLGSAACVAVVVEFLEQLRLRKRRPVVVLDPVVRSSSGKALLEPEGLRLLGEKLLSLVDVATPNVEELGVLGGCSDLAGAERIVAAGRDLQRRFPRLGLVVTGGDLEPPDDLLLMPPDAGTEPVWLRGERVYTTSTHGTGCAFSSALLSHLVHGDEPQTAARRAKQYVASAMRAAAPRGRGRGPMDPFWYFRGNRNMARTEGD